MPYAPDMTIRCARLKRYNPAARRARAAVVAGARRDWRCLPL